MICKECGAYNPDHATYCKVCAANLKGSPVEEAPAAPEEDLQPTKRFSRPSWVVPEQVAKPVEPEAPEAEEPEAVVEEARPASGVRPSVILPEEPEPEPEPEEPVEEDDAPAWTPKPVSMRIEPDEKDDSDEPEDEDDEEESVYNDEETLEDDDSFEYEPTPPKRRTAKKKSSPLFTVLLIAIIVVIVAILGVLGYLLLSNRGESGSSPIPGLNCSGADRASTDDPTESAAPSEPAQTNAPQADMTHATITDRVNDSGTKENVISVLVPSHATVTFVCPHQDNKVITNENDYDTTYAVAFEEGIFFPNTPLETAEYTATPEISVTRADGTSYQVECPSISYTFPALSISLTAPQAKEDGTYMADENNIVRFEGLVNEDQDVKLSVNGVDTPVYVGGVFSYDYTMNSETAETIKLVASKNNRVTASTEIEVNPYVFVPDPMTLEVKDDLASLRADKTGKLTVTGKTLPGATLTATSDNTANVLCGTVTVDAEGNFSFGITMDPSFYGLSTITLNATKEGAEDGTETFIVSRSYADKSAFIKALQYYEIPKHVTIQEMLANQTQYASNANGFRVTATVSEIINDGDETIVKMTVNKTDETIYVHNLSTKWAPSDNIGKKYNVYGNFVGTYQDTGCVEFYGWFAQTAK